MVRSANVGPTGIVYIVTMARVCGLQSVQLLFTFFKHQRVRIT